MFIQQNWRWNRTQIYWHRFHWKILLSFSLVDLHCPCEISFFSTRQSRVWQNHVSLLLWASFLVSSCLRRLFLHSFNLQKINPYSWLAFSVSIYIHSECEKKQQCKDSLFSVCTRWYKREYLTKKPTISRSYYNSFSMSTSTQNTNNNQSGSVIPAGDPNQILLPGTVGTNPQSTLNPNGRLHVYCRKE